MSRHKCSDIIVKKGERDEPSNCDQRNTQIELSAKVRCISSNERISTSKKDLLSFIVLLYNYIKLVYKCASGGLVLVLNHWPIKKEQRIV